jgi:predicted DNA-binding transcriptional regulator YafY
LAVVQDAIVNEKQIHVVYHAAERQDKKEKTYCLHSLGLIQRGSVTYLVAMSNEYEEAYLYAIHRIKSAELLEQDSRKKKGFNLDEYANHQGHFGSGELIEFKARISDHLAIMLEETPLIE